MKPAGRASDADVFGGNRLNAILVVVGNGFFGACVGYVEYVEDIASDNASSTKQKPFTGYIDDTRIAATDKCRSGRRHKSC
jgi:hypothetical protein